MADRNGRHRRRLSPEERRLWEQVASTTSPLWQSSPAQPPAPPRPATTEAPPESPRTTQPAGRQHASRPPDAPPPGKPATLRPSGGRDADASRVTHAPPEAAPVRHQQPGLDHRTAKRLRKGTREPDARIDLHGMTAARAHRACLRFLGDASARGDRVVLVITGKGGRDQHGYATGRGILRAALPGWLRASPFGHSIVGIYQAHRRHGGEGAFYIYLKRHR